MKNVLKIFSLFVLFLTACENRQEITQLEDYQDYIQNPTQDKLDLVNEQIEFWEAKQSNQSSSLYQMQLASLYSAKYKLNGDVNNLGKAQNLLEIVAEVLKENSAGVYRMLAANLISQHEFKQAYNFALKASEIKDKQYASKLVLFDVCMELAYYDQAEAILQELEDKESFAYEIRLAKWLDYKGELDQAVVLMENGLQKISPNNTALKLWTLSNLGDMYGHQGKIQKAYQSYLDALAIDREYYYALKGIAYIAFAHDNNIQEAKEILEFLDENHPIPDYKLMLAEIADAANNYAKSQQYKEDFYAEVSQAKYGNMYNAYILDLDLEAKRFEKALSLAQQEVLHRSTPESYDFLAWAFYQSGEKEKALEIAQKHVENKTFEPGASYHLGILYSQVDESKSIKLLNEALEARFELGPQTSREILQALASI